MPVPGLPVSSLLFDGLSEIDRRLMLWTPLKRGVRASLVLSRLLQTFQCSLALARRPFPDSPAKLRLIRGTAKSLTVFNTAGGLRRAPGSDVPEKRVQSYALYP